MDGKILHIRITGHSVNVDAEGFVGASCEKVCEQLDEMLETLHREDKPERFKQEHQNVTDVDV